MSWGTTRRTVATGTAKPMPADEPLGFVTFQQFPTAHDLWPTYQVKGMLKDGCIIDVSCCLKASSDTLAVLDNLLRQLPASRLTGRLMRDLALPISYLQARNQQLGVYQRFREDGRAAQPLVLRKSSLRRGCRSSAVAAPLQTTATIHLAPMTLSA